MVKWLVNWKEEKGCPCLRHVLQGYIHYWHNVGRTNQIKGQPFSNWKARFQKSFMSNNSKTGASILISNSLSVSLQKEVRPAAVFKNKGCCVKHEQCLYVNSKYFLQCVIFIFVIAQEESLRQNSSSLPRAQGGYRHSPAPPSSPAVRSLGTPIRRQVSKGLLSFVPANLDLLSQMMIGLWPS